MMKKNTGYPAVKLILTALLLAFVCMFVSCAGPAEPAKEGLKDGLSDAEIIDIVVDNMMQL